MHEQDRIAFLWPLVHIMNAKTATLTIRNLNIVGIKWIAGEIAKTIVRRS
jgi:hypothetical protein